MYTNIRGEGTSYCRLIAKNKLDGQPCQYTLNHTEMYYRVKHIEQALVTSCKYKHQLNANTDRNYRTQMHNKLSPPTHVIHTWCNYQCRYYCITCLQTACVYCKRLFSETSSLRRHLNSVHFKLRYSCDVCGKTYSQVAHVTRHKKMVHW